MPDTRQNLLVIKMTSDIYKVMYKALSPIHIGYKSIGVLDTTRYYITGKAVWGAMTAAVTRYLIDAPSSKDYTRMGSFVKKNIRATYFFPTVNNTLYCPGYEFEEIKYGDLSKNAFEKTFIYSFVSTALDLTKTAEDDTLHEVEYIKNRVRMKETIQDVHWTGYLFVDEEEKDDLEIKTEEVDFTIMGGKNEMKASEIFKGIQVGGERNYGLGKLELEGNLEKINRKTGRIFNSMVEGDRIRSNIALGHVHYADIPYVGDVEPLVGREWSKEGSGRKVTINTQGQNAQGIFFVPGTCFKCEHMFEIAEYGVWNWMRNG